MNSNAIQAGQLSGMYAALGERRRITRHDEYQADIPGKQDGGINSVVSDWNYLGIFLTARSRRSDARTTCSIVSDPSGSSP
jgi:hypothetical protein